MARKIVLTISLLLLLLIVAIGCEKETRESFRKLKDDDPKVRMEAIDDLVEYDKFSTLPTGVKEALMEVAENDGNTIVRIRAIIGLCPLLYEEGKELLPFLLKLLKDNDPYVRAAIIDLLPMVMRDEGQTLDGREYKRPKYDELIPILVEALDDEHPRVREEALEELSLCGIPETGNELTDEADNLITRIKDVFLNDEDYYVRLRAATVLAGVDKSFEEPIPLLVEGMNKGRMRRESIIALRHYGQSVSHITRDLIEIVKATPAGPGIQEIIANAMKVEDVDLMQTLKRGNPNSYLLEALEEYDPDWVEIIERVSPFHATIVIHRTNGPDEELNNYLGYDDIILRSVAGSTLRYVASEPEDIQLLIDALEDENPYLRGDAAVALSFIHPEHIDIVPKLIEMMDDEDAYVHTMVISALGFLGPSEAERTGPVLIKALTKSKDFDSYIDVMRALEDAGIDAVRASIRLLEEEVGSENIDHLLLTLDFFVGISENRKQALIDLLDDESARTRYYTILTIGYVGYDGVDTLLPLLEHISTSDEDEIVRQAAKGAIEYLSSDNRYKLQDEYLDKFFNYPGN